MVVLSNPDNEKIKRVIPKATNKVIDSTACKLYIAYPDPTQWTDTGLMGAIVLVDDLVGHTFFLKLVDITGSRGVIWDQELYVDFAYHQDRTFFHTFEIEECVVGLLFDDTLDASRFYKKVVGRKKLASKQTANNKNTIELKNRLTPSGNKVGSRGEFVDANTGQRSRRAKGVLYYDDQPPPEWRLLYAELAAAGITEEMIAENREFIRNYITQQGGPLVGLEPPIPRRYAQGNAGQSGTSSTVILPPPEAPKKIKKAPPPPPPSNPTFNGSEQMSTPYDSSYSPSPVASAAPSAPPTPAPHVSTNDASSNDSDSQLLSPAVANNIVSPQSRFRLPPANASIPHVAHPTVVPSFLPAQSATPEPQTYHHTPINGQRQPQQFNAAPSSVHNAPPPLPPSQGNRVVPQPPPRAGRPAMPLPPRVNTNSIPEIGGAPPAPPPRASRAVPPPPPARNASTMAPPPVSQQQQPHQQPSSYPMNSQISQSQGYTPNATHVPPPPVALPPRQEPSPMAPPPMQQPPVIRSDPNYKAPPPPQRSQAPKPVAQAPPPLPPTQNQAASNSAPPPLPPTQNIVPSHGTAPLPPPLQHVNPPNQQEAPPLPPPPPTAQQAPPPPPPPPPQTGGAPPPAPPPPTLMADSAPSAPGAPPMPLASGDSSRDALLASIRGSGIGMLKKTDKSQLEKPSVLLSEARGVPVVPSAQSASGQPETLADALASALNKRKGKVAASDDEDDNDEW